jgi:pyruvate formate lyase activating enzyme
MQNIDIKGVQKTSLLDYPGKVCAVVFLSRCNFRCPFCHNPELVFDKIKESIEPEEILSFLMSKKKWLDGVCITGGEPMLHPGVIEFAKKIKGMGMLVKIDTNGTNPKMLKEMIGMKLVDYIAMDIKSDRETYSRAAGINADMKSINESTRIIMDSGIDYEFRTTVVPGLFDSSTAKNIAGWLSGAKRIFLQQFRNTDRVLDPKYQSIEHYHTPQLEEFRKIMEKDIKEVGIRGV